MTRWARDAKEFDVSLTKSKNKGTTESVICRVPVPIFEKLGKPKRLNFKIQGKKIIVEGLNKNGK